MTMGRIFLESSSFRDPEGFLFFYNGKLYRQINQKGKNNFDLLINSGLYQKLVEKKFLIPHTEVSLKIAATKDAYKIIKPQSIPFISYPYEWSFSQLKDAALLTLEIQKIALEHNMSLKDASAYNIQFIGYKPIFIDTLSFERYQEDEPWIAYRQFCQHFLAPLSLIIERDPRFNLLLRDFIDGIPLDLVSHTLPLTTKLKLPLLTHIHFHALNQKRMVNKRVDKNKYKMKKLQMFALIENLKSTIEKMKMKKFQTEWQKYYHFMNYSNKAFENKKFIVKNFLYKIKPQSVIDLGANEGIFSQIASQTGAYTIACDIDPFVVEEIYLKAKKNKNKYLLPLVIDLTNPSPGLGWQNKERKPFSERVKVDCVLALALIHHLAISNNLPLELISQYFASLGKYLIIEFVPKQDSNVQILLQNRKDIFDEYSKEAFEKIFSKYFQILEKKKIKESKREVYLMKRK